MYYPDTNPYHTAVQRVFLLIRQWASINGELKRRLIFTIALLATIFALELFNFSTTQFALNNLLGQINVMGLPWATILAVAFCAVDFAGLTRLFSPTESNRLSLETWYLLGAWFLTATLNAIMTWWAVTLVMMPAVTGNEVLSRQQLLTYVPIAIAGLVWITRLLVIGAFNLHSGRLLNDGPAASLDTLRYTVLPATPARRLPQPTPASATGNRPALTNRPRRLAPKYSFRPQATPTATVLPKPRTQPMRTPARPTAPLRQPVQPQPAPMPHPEPADTNDDLQYEDVEKYAAFTQPVMRPDTRRAAHTIGKQAHRR